MSCQLATLTIVVKGIKTRTTRRASGLHMNRLSFHIQSQNGDPTSSNLLGLRLDLSHHMPLENLGWRYQVLNMGPSTSKAGLNPHYTGENLHWAIVALAWFCASAFVPLFRGSTWNALGFFKLIFKNWPIQLQKARQQQVCREMENCQPLLFFKKHQGSLRSIRSIHKYGKQRWRGKRHLPTLKCTQICPFWALSQAVKHVFLYQKMLWENWLKEEKSCDSSSLHTTWYVLERKEPY